jgi:hypothetical protein
MNRCEYWTILPFSAFDGRVLQDFA